MSSSLVHDLAEELRSDPEVTKLVAPENIHPFYRPDSCCACRWVVWNEDCGHGPADGINSPHDHCDLHGRSEPDALDAEELDPSAPWNIAGVDR